jgi:hypothetical protein
LLLPIYGGDGRLWSIEAINADGSKDSLKGVPKRGGFHPLGKIRGASRVLIAEGLANAAVGWAVDGSERRQWVSLTSFMRRWPCESSCPKPRSSSSLTTV